MIYYCTLYCMQAADWGQFFWLRSIPIWYGHFLELKTIASRDINGIAAVASVASVVPGKDLEKLSARNVREQLEVPYAHGLTHTDTCWHRENLWTFLDDLVHILDNLWVHFRTLWVKMIKTSDIGWQLNYWTPLRHKAIECYGHIFVCQHMSTQGQHILRRRLVCKRMDCWRGKMRPSDDFKHVAWVSHWWACYILLPSVVCCMVRYGKPLSKWQHSFGMAHCHLYIFINSRYYVGAVSSWIRC